MSLLLQRFFLSTLLMLFSAAAMARQWTHRSYLVADGLPANNTSALVIDGRGFLWIGTENGLARFDGNRFRNFSSVNGLPDNEISALSLDPQGHVVVWTYRNAPVRFDAPANRFVPATAPAPDRSPGAVRLGGASFYCDSSKLYKVRGSSVTRRNLPFAPARLGFNGRHLTLISENGIAAALIDSGDLQVSPLPLGGALARQLLEDVHGNLWISTAGQGLLKLSMLPAISYASLLPTDMAPSVVAVAGETVVCGDDKGRIAFFRHGCLEALVNISRWSRAVSRIRAILPLHDGFYVAVEGDASLRFDKSYQVVSVYNRPWLNYSDRCAAVFRDSIILAGGHERSVRLNLRSCVAADSVPLRSTAISADRLGRVVIGTATGLYRQDDTGLLRFADKIPDLGQRVTDICLSPDGLLWIGLAGAQLMVLEGERLVETIPLNRSLPGTGVASLCAGRPGEIWVGTDKGLSRLLYRFSAGRLTRNVTAFGPMDGVSGQISDLAWQSDTIYAASSNGLFALPAATEPMVADVPVFITGISINDRDTLLLDNWTVPYELNDWTIHFAGIDPAGSDPVFQYSMNGSDWQDAEGDVLSLRQLAPGKYKIRIRALRRDGRPSAAEAGLSIRIAAPFWHALWFWALLFLIVLSAAVLGLQLIFRGRRARQLRRLQSEHALATSQQQTFAALMNPHFIFNALNSIQHFVLAKDRLQANRYLSGFGRLIRLNFESAQQSYIPLDEELTRLRLYLELEQMRFGEKLRWDIVVAEEIEPSEFRIPAMILQPFLENALMHGIAPAKIGGVLILEISEQEGGLRISIRDNGIGIANSKRLRAGNGHRSRGMELIRRRLELLKQLHGARIELRITDVNPANADQPGTEVQLLIPELPA